LRCPGRSSKEWESNSYRFEVHPERLGSGVGSGVASLAAPSAPDCGKNGLVAHYCAPTLG
jgi:hypothetical protein